MKPANFAPAYASIYPVLAEICRNHGYALAVHGSMARDFDVVAIPWVDDAADPDIVVGDITDSLALHLARDPDVVAHGRIRYAITMWGEGFVDLSFMPRRAQPKPWKDYGAVGRDIGYAILRACRARRLSR